MADNLEAGVRRAMIASLISIGVLQSIAETRVDPKLAEGVAWVKAAFATESAKNKQQRDDECWRRAFQMLKTWTIQNA